MGLANMGGACRGLRWQGRSWWTRRRHAGRGKDWLRPFSKRGRGPATVAEATGEVSGVEGRGQWVKGG